MLNGVTESLSDQATYSEEVDSQNDDDTAEAPSHNHVTGPVQTVGPRLFQLE